MLGVSPNTLRSWERRYGFPRPRRTQGGHRQYALNEIESLRVTLAETHNVSSAIALARQRGEGPSSGSRLAAAFATFDEDKANGLLEESLALRSVERTIEEVLLEGVAAHADDAAAGNTPEYEFAWRHATGWLSALKRLAPPATRAAGVLVLDASAPLELDGLYAQALELMLRRTGVRTPVAVDRDHAEPPGAGIAGARSARGRARGPEHHARRARTTRLLGPLGRQSGGDLRLPRRGARHRSEHGPAARSDAAGGARRVARPARGGRSQPLVDVRPRRTPDHRALLERRRPARRAPAS